MSEDKKWITKNVVLFDRDMEIIQELQDDLALGERGFSAALRVIIREWEASRVEIQRIQQANKALSVISDYISED